MTMQKMDFVSIFQGRVALLNHAFAAGDQTAFEAALDALNEGRQTPLLADVLRLSDNLQQALSRFRADSRMAVLAHQEIPDARLRLEHVLTVTEDAAHKTLDLIENSVPLADATVRNAKELLTTLDERSHNDIRRFLDEARVNFETVRSNLSEVMLTQGFQDLTGQILRGVQRLIAELEKTLVELTRIAGTSPAPASVAGGRADVEGPAVPGVTRNAVTDQADVDDLIAGLGI